MIAKVTRAALLFGNTTLVLVTFLTLINLTD